MMTKEDRQVAIVASILTALILFFGATCRSYQCRNAPDKLACWLSERVVYVVPSR